MLRANRLVVLLTGVALLAALLILWPADQPATAQYVEGDMRQLLTDLWNRVMESQSSDTVSSFVFTISFDSSIAGLGNSVTFGQDLANLSLREAGENYFCVGRQFSRTTNVDCIPYTNVVKVSYAERG